MENDIEKSVLQIKDEEKFHQVGGSTTLSEMTEMEEWFGFIDLWTCRNCTHLNQFISRKQCTVCGKVVKMEGETPEIVDSVDISLVQIPLPFRTPRIGYCYDSRMLLHRDLSPDRFNPHPERPDRILAIFSHLQASGCLFRCIQIPSRLISEEELCLVHEKQVISQVFSTVFLPRSNITQDTYACPHTNLAARLSVGCVVDSALAVARGEIDHAIAIVRPPGHHAEPSCCMGFCMFNNVAVATRVVQVKNSWEKRGGCH